MHELLQEIRIGISLGFRFPLAARRYVRCAHMELQFLRNLGASCGPCLFPVASRFAIGTPALPRYAPRSVTMRGGPSPSVVGPCLLRSLGRRPYREGFARPAEGHRRPSNFFILGAKLAPSSHFFAICLHFFRTMLRSCVFYRFPMVFEWILEGLGKILGVFWRWFFTRFSKN